jgi:hypothetical protein
MLGIALAVLRSDGGTWVTSSVDCSASSVNWFLFAIDNGLPAQGGFVSSVGQLFHDLLPDLRREHPTIVIMASSVLASKARIILP